MNTQNYINNTWCDAESGKTFDVENPFTEEVIAKAVSYTHLTLPTKRIV